jgi:hypothetical protein
LNISSPSNDFTLKFFIKELITNEKIPREETMVAIGRYGKRRRDGAREKK